MFNNISYKYKGINIIYLLMLTLSIFHLLYSMKYHKLSNIDDAWLLSLYYNIYHNNLFESIAIGNDMTIVGGLQSYVYEYIQISLT